MKIKEKRRKQEIVRIILKSSKKTVDFKGSL